MKSANIEDILLDAFKTADKSGKVGALAVDEFIRAYNVLYTRVLNDSTAKAAEEENWVKATRYGFMGVDESGDNRYIFECYVGTINNISKVYIFDLPNINGTTQLVVSHR